MVVQGALTNWVGLSIAFNTRLMPLCRIFLHPSDLTFKLLRKSTSYFGHNPRQCFEASASVAKLGVKRSDVESVIIGAAVYGSDSIMQLLFKTQTGGSDVSPTIFQISPRDTDAKQLLSNCQFESVSR
jgi:hypothetical protein